MAEINWGILQNHDIGGTFLNALATGREMRRKDDTRNAMAALVQNPNDATALGNLAKQDPVMAMQFRKQQADSAANQQEALMKRAEMQSKLLGTVSDEASYQRALGAARQMGLPLDNVPPNYDPNWVTQSKMIAEAFKKDGGQSLSTYGKIAQDRGLAPGTQPFFDFVAKAYEADQVKTIPYTQGGGVAGYNAMTGVTNTIVAPNPGGITAGTPVSGGGGPQPGAVVGGYRFKGGNPNDRNNWEQVGQGGGGARVTSNFLDGL